MNVVVLVMCIIVALSEPSDETAADLIRALKSSDVKVCHAALNELFTLDSSAPACVPAVVDLLANPDEYLRGRAAVALGVIGSGSRTAAQALVRMLTDDRSSYARAVAAQALRSLTDKSTMP